MNPAAGLRSSGRSPHTAYDDIVASMLADRDVERLERSYEVAQWLATPGRREATRIERGERRRQRSLAGLGTVR